MLSVLLLGVLIVNSHRSLSVVRAKAMRNVIVKRRIVWEL